MAILVAAWIPEPASFSSFLPGIMESWKIRFKSKTNFGCFIGAANQIRDALQAWAADAAPRPDRIVLIACSASGAGLSESARELGTDWHASIPFTLIPILFPGNKEDAFIDKVPARDCLDICQPILLHSINCAGKKLLAVELESAALELLRAFALADQAEFATRDFAAQEEPSAPALRLMFGDKATQARRIAIADYSLFCLHHSDPNKACEEIPLWEPAEKASSVSIPAAPTMSLYSPSRFEEWLHEKEPNDEAGLIQNAINKTVIDFRPTGLFREFATIRLKVEASLPRWVSELNYFLQKALTGGASLLSMGQCLKKRCDQLAQNPNPIACPPLTSKLANEVSHRLSGPAAAARHLAFLYRRARKSWKLLAWPAIGGFLTGALLIARLAYSWFTPALESLAWSALCGGLVIGVGTSLLVRFLVLAYRRETARKSYALLRERLDSEFRLIWQTWLKGSAAWLDHHLARYGAGYSASILRERIERLEDHRHALEAFPGDSLGNWAFPAFAEKRDSAQGTEQSAEHEEEVLRFMGRRIFEPFPNWIGREAIVGCLWRTLDEWVEELAADGEMCDGMPKNAEELFRKIRTSALVHSRLIEDRPSLRWFLRPPKSQMAVPAGIEISMWQRNDVHLCFALFPYKSDAAQKPERTN